MTLTLKEARYQAIELAESLPIEAAICIYRVQPRQFNLEVGITPLKAGLVQIINVEWIGWYKKYHPDYFRPTLTEEQ